jgi:hypothetical protein
MKELDVDEMEEHQGIPAPYIHLTHDVQLLENTRSLAPLPSVTDQGFRHAEPKLETRN